ncbi:MAG: PAS domain S-box protein [Spirochaetes bacterium]|nr:PAS domain S-box protein [Spirochaetota bacterium]
MKKDFLKIILFEQITDYSAKLNEHLEKSGLQKYKYQTRKLSGVSQIKENDADVIILSHSFQKTSDIETVRTFIENCGSTPVIIISDNDHNDFASKSIELGAGDFILKKNLNPEILKRIILYTLERNRKTRELLLRNRELSESISRMELLLLSIDDPVIVSDNDNNVIMTNYASEKFFGKTSDEIKKIKSTDLLKSVDENNSQITCTHRDLTYHGIVSRKMIPWNNADAELITIKEISERINHEKTIIQKEKYYRSILQKIHEDIIVIDSESRIIDINNSVLQTTGFTIEEIINKKFPDIFFAIPEKAETDFIKRAISETFKYGKHHNFMMQYSAKNGRYRYLDVILSPITDDLSVLYIAAALHDVTDLVESQKKLLETTSRLNLALKSASIGIWDYDVVNDKVFNSIEWKNQLGYKDDEFAESTGIMGKLLHPDDRERVSEYMKNALDNKTVDYSIEFRLRHKDGSYIWVHSTADIYHDSSNRIIRMLGCHFDITQRKLNEEKFRMLFETMEQGVIYHRPDGTIIEMNPAAEKIFGINRSLILKNQSFDKIMHPIHENGESFTSQELPSIQAFKSGKRTAKILMGIKNKNEHKIHWLNTVGVPEFRSGEKNPFRAYCTFEDITKDRDNQQILENSLIEKEILLKEIHHRVKNNLQLISSMLGLQQRQIEEKKYRDLFIESQNRIKAIAIIHEKLYQSKDLSNINFKEYVQSFLNYLYQVYQDIAHEITMENNIDNIFMPVDIAIPCGLLINEITSNAFKHAFKDQNKGKIIINLSKTDNLYSIFISDNGSGISEELDISNSSTLGMKLIAAFIEQLNGKYEIIKNPGTSYKITFNYGDTSNGI